MIEQSTEFQQALCTTTYENGKLSHMNWMLCKSTAEIDNMDFSASTPLSSSSAPSPPLVVTGSEATGGGDGRIKMRTLRVIVKMPNGTNDYFMIANGIDDDSFIKGRIAEKHGCPVECQLLLWGGREIKRGALNFSKRNDDEVTLHLRVKDCGDVVYDEGGRDDTTEQDDHHKYPVTVKTISGRTIIIMCLPNDGLTHIMRRIQYHEGPAPSKQYLVFAGRLIDDVTVTLSAAGVCDGSIIKMATSEKEWNIFEIRGHFSENGVDKFTLDLCGDDDIDYIKSAIG